MSSNDVVESLHKETKVSLLEEPLLSRISNHSKFLRFLPCSIRVSLLLLGATALSFSAFAVILIGDSSKLQQDLLADTSSNSTLEFAMMVSTSSQPRNDVVRSVPIGLIVITLGIPAFLLSLCVARHVSYLTPTADHAEFFIGRLGQRAPINKQVVWILCFVCGVTCILACLAGALLAAGVEASVGVSVGVTALLCSLAYSMGAGIVVTFLWNEVDAWASHMMLVVNIFAVILLLAACATMMHIGLQSFENDVCPASAWFPILEPVILHDAIAWTFPSTHHQFVEAVSFLFSVLRPLQSVILKVPFISALPIVGLAMSHFAVMERPPVVLPKAALGISASDIQDRNSFFIVVIALEAILLVLSSEFWHFLLIVIPGYFSKPSVSKTMTRHVAPSSLSAFIAYHLTHNGILYIIVDIAVCYGFCSADSGLDWELWVIWLMFLILVCNATAIFSYSQAVGQPLPHPGFSVLATILPVLGNDLHLAKDWVFIGLCFHQSQCNQGALSWIGLCLGLFSVAALFMPLPSLIRDPVAGESFIASHWPIFVAKPAPSLGSSAQKNTSLDNMISSLVPQCTKAKQLICILNECPQAASASLFWLIFGGDFAAFSLFVSLAKTLMIPAVRTQILPRLFRKNGSSLSLLDFASELGLNEQVFGYGHASLHVSAKNPKLTNAIPLLLERRASPELQSTSQSTALHEAALSNNLDACNFLIQGGAPLDAKMAIFQGTSTSSQQISNKKTFYSVSPLHIAAFQQNLEICQRLTNARADINAVCKKNLRNNDYLNADDDSQTWATPLDLLWMQVGEDSSKLASLTSMGAEYYVVGRHVTRETVGDAMPSNTIDPSKLDDVAERREHGGALSNAHCWRRLDQI